MEEEKKEIKPKITFQFTEQGLFAEIETENLLIESYRESHFEHCVPLYGDEKLSRHFDHGLPRSREEVASLMATRGLKYFLNGEPLGLFSIFDKETKDFVGQADLLPIEGNDSVELGCILHRKFHNRGFAVEVCQVLMREYIEKIHTLSSKFNQLIIKKVVATAHPKNFASQRLIKNLGMLLEKLEDRFGNPRLWYSFFPQK